VRVVCTQQHTHEWYQGRLGIFTASRAVDGMATYKVNAKGGKKGEYNKAHWDYVRELAWERITGVPYPHHVTDAMEAGNQYEPLARIEYWQRTGIEVEETGLVLHPTFDYIACSPDGLVGTDGGIEIKIFVLDNFLELLDVDTIPAKYLPQMYTNMLCCGRDWWEFVAYCPGDDSQTDLARALPDEFRLYRKRLLADTAKFAEIEEAATVTMQHVAERMETLRRMYPSKGEPKSKFVAELEMSTDMADTLAAYDEYVMGETA
jgi:hypothetical protein